MSSYYCDDNFEKYPAEYWRLVVNWALAKANYVELCFSFSANKPPAVLVAAEVPLPLGIPRVYCATHRFLLTEAVAAFISSKQYQDFDYAAAGFEDVAFFHDDTLLMGAISHEDYVVLLLTRLERQLLNAQGFGFWSEWTLE